MNGLRHGLCALATLAFVGLGTNAFAGDTTELVDKGAIEVDPVFSVDNLHDGKPLVSTELGIVYGVLDGFNIGGGVAFASEEGMNGMDASLNVNALATPVDTDHVDLDVRVDFDWAVGDGYSLTPSFEFNYDYEPDLAAWGLYLRFGLPIYGQPFAAGEEVDDLIEAIGGKAPKQKGADVGISLTLGAYLTFAEVHQIILEGGFNYNNLAENFDEAVLEEGFVSVGYNVVINDSFELTTELAFHLPCNDDEEFNAGLTVGGIFTIGGGSDGGDAE